MEAVRDKKRFPYIKSVSGYSAGVEWATYREKEKMVTSQKEFSKSLPLLEEVLQTNPDDKAARIYLERLAKFIVNPVGEDWEGVETMGNK